MLLGQSPVDISGWRVHGVPVELSVLPQLLRPSSPRYVRRRGGATRISLCIQQYEQAKEHK
jgi:hypothetical protein